MLKKVENIVAKAEIAHHLLLLRQNGSAGGIGLRIHHDLIQKETCYIEKHIKINHYCSKKIKKVQLINKSLLKMFIKYQILFPYINIFNLFLCTV